VPNQTEAALITQMAVPDMVAAKKAAEKLRTMGPKLVIITMGEQGAFVLSDTMCETIAAFRVQAMDTTAAGDAFCGALAAALSHGEDVRTAISFGCAAGALATTKLGAEPSLPSLSEIKKLMLEQQCAV
jgi:ribokinase